MGMTLWIHTLEGRNMSKESADHSLMHDRADDLDEICKALHVPPLTSFFDTTDLEFNLSDEEEDDKELDPETKLGYGIDDMKWFDAATGLRTLTALRSYVSGNSALELDSEQKAMLLEELADCIETLKSPAASGGKFHLAVIM